MPRDLKLFAVFSVCALLIVVFLVPPKDTIKMVVLCILWQVSYFSASFGFRLMSLKNPYSKEGRYFSLVYLERIFTQYLEKNKDSDDKETQECVERIQPLFEKEVEKLHQLLVPVLGVKDANQIPIANNGNTLSEQFHKVVPWRIRIGIEKLKILLKEELPSIYQTYFPRG